MRQVILSIWSIIFVLSINTTIIGQTNDMPHIKVVYSHNNLPIESEEFIEDLRNELQTENYRLELVESSTDANFAIDLALDENEQIIVTIQPLTPINLPQSPILYASYSQPFVHYVQEWESEIESLVTLSTGIALYSVEEWYLASDKLNYAYNLVVKDTLEQAHFISFYEANCYVATSQYERATYEFMVSVIGVDFVPLYVNSIWTLLQLDTDWTSRYGEKRDFYLEHNYNVLDQIINQVKPHAPKVIEIWSARAQLYALEFDYNQAIADMEDAILLAEAINYPNDLLAELYTLRGEIIFLIYEWDRVLENLNTALDLNSDYAPAYFQRGVLYYTMALREEALADFQHYLELAPDDIHSEEAQHYIDSIQIELDTLGG